MIGLSSFWRTPAAIVFVLCLVLPFFLKTIKSPLIFTLLYLLLFLLASSLTYYLAVYGKITLKGWYVNLAIITSLIVLFLNQFKLQLKYINPLAILIFGLFFGAKIASHLNEMPLRIINYKLKVRAFHLGSELSLIAWMPVVLILIWILTKTKSSTLAKEESSA